MMLENKVAIVTGAGRGIGREIALLMAKEGARVVVNDLGSGADGRGEERSVADQVAEEIRAAGGKAVANYDSVVGLANGERIVATALEAFGRIDIVVNNAGILRDRMLFNMSEEEWDAVVDVHLKGTFSVTRAAAPHLRKQNSGRLIHFTSTAGLIGNVGQANYGAAKMGIVGFSKICALDLARYNVTSNVIAPFAWTRLIATIPTDDPAQAERVEKLKKMSPAHIAPLVCYLASDDAQGITGQIFGVRGKEIMLFSQPRPVRSIISEEGWTPEKLKAMLKGAFGTAFYGLDTSPSVFPYDPIV